MKRIVNRRIEKAGMAGNTVKAIYLINDRLRRYKAYLKPNRG